MKQIAPPPIATAEDHDISLIQAEYISIPTGTQYTPYCCLLYTAVGCAPIKQTAFFVFGLGFQRQKYKEIGTLYSTYAECRIQNTTTVLAEEFNMYHTYT